MQTGWAAIGRTMTSTKGLERTSPKEHVSIACCILPHFTSLNQHWSPILVKGLVYQSTPRSQTAKHRSGAELWLTARSSHTIAHARVRMLLLYCRASLKASTFMIGHDSSNTPHNHIRWMSCTHSLGCFLREPFIDLKSKVREFRTDLARYLLPTSLLEMETLQATLGRLIALSHTRDKTWLCFMHQWPHRGWSTAAARGLV